MKNNKTELVFILDRSGSMEGLEKDTIGGFNSMLKKQKAIDGECLITTVLFDNTLELLHDRIDIRAVHPLTEKDYEVGGCTALLDAIGSTITKIRKVQKYTSDEYRAENVLFVIITDGFENASREYSSDQVKQMIETQKKESGWKFIFLGANIDAVETAGHIGIAPEWAQSFRADSCGVRLNFGGINSLASSMRKSESSDCAPADWKEAIQKHFEKKSK
ncbi:MAG: vWA domain-containing protein [Eubacteriaceae bacterium]